MNTIKHSQKRRARVLVVDDDATCRLAVTSKLENLCVDVVEAEEGGEALILLQRHSFELAIIDLEMPGMSGYSLLGCMRGIKELKHVPVVVLTSHLDPECIERALVAGATSFLSKPLNWLAFGAHIEHIISLSLGVNQTTRSPRNMALCVDVE